MGESRTALSWIRRKLYLLYGEPPRGLRRVRYSMGVVVRREPSAMTTRDQLVFALQDQYAFLRDFLPVLNVLRHDVDNQHLHRLLDQERDGMQGEMETLDRALNLLGARYTCERSPLAPGFREKLDRFKHRHSPAQEQLGIYAVITMMAVAQLLIGGYQGDAELASAIGEQDVATLLEENAQRQQAGLRALQRFASPHIRDIGQAEARPAA